MAYHVNIPSLYRDYTYNRFVVVSYVSKTILRISGCCICCTQYIRRTIIHLWRYAKPPSSSCLFADTTTKGKMLVDFRYRYNIANLEQKVESRESTSVFLEMAIILRSYTPDSVSVHRYCTMVVRELVFADALWWCILMTTM